MDKKINTLIGTFVLLLVGCLAFIFVITRNQSIFPQLNQLNNLINRPANQKTAINQIKKFVSEQDFKDYLAKAESVQSTSVFNGSARSMAMPAAVPGMGVAEKSLNTVAADNSANRVSETNVQVVGIDEPDIVKTDGQEIYFSPAQYLYYPMMEKRAPSSIGTDIAIMPPYPQNQKGILAIKATPPTDLTKKNILDQSGNLLLDNNILMVLPDQNYYNGSKIFAYDVTDPSNPKEKWTITLGENTSLAGARLYNNQVYLITRTGTNSSHPCPLLPLTTSGSQALSIACGDIYHPDVVTPADSTYVISKINLADGQAVNNVSFIGSNDNSIIYMSPKAIYLTYFYSGDMIKYFINFAKANQDLIPDSLTAKLAKLQTYDISDNAKMTEFYYLWQKYSDSLNNDDRLKIENELTNRMKNYAKDHLRELENTGIVKVALDSLNVTANGNIPGRPLNQFSLDEYQDNLRIATTVGGNWWGIGLINSASESANDVYILDKNLNQIGAIKDLGLTERIYSARFIEDKGYLVTFRQTDPFFVLDLSNPNNPKKAGELKIPGFSSYLHPLAKNMILGVGQENSRVKLSIFDVSNPTNPSELNKYNLDEYWTEVSNNHHAFLQDADHQIFFLPGSKGGYVFSYNDNKLSLQKAASDIVAKRALYINDYLYIIGENKLVVLNEKTWEKVNQLDY
jgi:inhibitor of cysteine peptidase